MARKEGPTLPRGGYKRLTTKKKLAETAAFYAGMTKKMLSGGNKQKSRRPYGKARGRGRPSKLMIAARDALLIGAPPAAPRAKRQATAKQLAALVRARAARAAKRGGTRTIKYKKD